MYVCGLEYSLNSAYPHHDYVAPGGGRVAESGKRHDTHLDYVGDFAFVGGVYDEDYNMVG